ncbi:hypothetical protein IEQ34_017590 [Dendrobium chrysotoxum]|uniref:DUF4283 domain-containing protein n=1 Tax=Dendrobium chrysotoxum TaxID=161865 RepID=A0AAV7GA18_DENCH|nr:hypothetical protein IEQ34_017590 [Dendrobium chrysotoxum]
MPVWIYFPNLRLYMFNFHFFYYLASIFCRPLETNQATFFISHPSFAWALHSVLECFSLHPQLCKHKDIIRYSKENDTTGGIIFLEPISLVQDSIVVSNKLNHNISIHTLHQFGDASSSHDEYEIDPSSSFINIDILVNSQTINFNSKNIDVEKNMQEREDSDDGFTKNRTKNLILNIYHADVTTLEDAEDILIWASLENQISNASEVFDVVIEEISSIKIMVDHDVEGNYGEQGGNVDVVPSLWNDRGVKDMTDCLSILV